MLSYAQKMFDVSQGLGVVEAADLQGDTTRACPRSDVPGRTEYSTEHSRRAYTEA